MNAMQCSLFDAGPVEASIPGLVYQPEFLSADEEKALLDIVATLPLQAARYKDYLARRRVVSFGGSFDYDANRLLPAAPLDARLEPLRSRVAAWLGIQPQALVHALVAEYAPGTPLGWHRDVPDFGRIVGVSLGGNATLRFRPYPYEPGLQRKVMRLVAAPRSIYRMEDEARWGWQHSVEPTIEARWSITLRTMDNPKRDRRVLQASNRPSKYDGVRRSSYRLGLLGQNTTTSQLLMFSQLGQNLAEGL